MNTAASTFQSDLSVVSGQTTVVLSSVRSLEFILRSSTCVKDGNSYPPFVLELAVASGNLAAATNSLFNGLSSDVHLSLAQVLHENN